MKPGDSVGDDYRIWADACRALNADEAKARTFRESRYAFTHILAGLLVKHLPTAGDDQVIYAVHLMGDHPRPVYLGTSSEGLRRLWDLPVGESHHLSNTYPPEIWARVQVLHWKPVLAKCGHDLAGIQHEVGKRFKVDAEESLKLIGMGIEFLFQKAVQPELNVRTKLRKGGFKAVDFDDSKSRQSEIATHWITLVFADLLRTWNTLQSEAANCTERVYLGEFGSVVFPGRVFSSQ